MVTRAMLITSLWFWLMIIALTLANGCVHIRRNSLYHDRYDVATGKYYDLRQCEYVISVALADDLTEYDRRVVRAALGQWSTWAGRALWVESTLDEARVVISRNDDGSYRHDAVAVAVITPGRFGCIVESEVILLDDLTLFSEHRALWIVTHELGHVLGFEDTDLPHRIMCGYVDRYLGEGITETELEALRLHYGAKGEQS